MVTKGNDACPLMSVARECVSEGWHLDTNGLLE
jgi:hypothetical protein